MKHLLAHRAYLQSLLFAALFLLVSFVANSYAVAYANKSISDPVTDIVLSNTRVYDVDGFFVYGAVLLVLLIAFVCLRYLRSAPFILKSIALFTIIRAFFVSLTHISPYPEHAAITPGLITNFFPSIFTGSDLFFSGHTGLPFLLALIFWDHVYLRFVFLGFSLMFAVVVLLGHLHYSIDVASAYFITYSIFTLAQVLFKKED